jgi:hypothetical protein
LQSPVPITAVRVADTIVKHADANSLEKPESKHASADHESTSPS